MEMEYGMNLRKGNGLNSTGKPLSPKGEQGKITNYFKFPFRG